MPSESETNHKKKMGRKNLLTGNWGEQYISEKLSSCECFVRHVPQGHDTGIDLYCETTSEDNRPFQHFWCQVKTSKFKGRNRSKKLNRQSENINVDYLLKQPIPVFVFFVPDLRNEDIAKEGMIPFYIFSAIDFYNSKEPIKSLLKIQKTEDLNNFLNEGLLIQTFRWDLMRGRVSHLPTPKSLYTIKFPKGQALNFEKKLQNSLRWTLRLLADDILDRNDSNAVSDTKCYAKMLETLAKQIEDKHYETYEVIGKYYHKTGDFEEALKKYKKSLETLHKDPDPEVAKNDIRWKSIFERIEAIIQELESREISIEGNPNGGADVCATMATNSNIKILK